MSGLFADVDTASLLAVHHHWSMVSGSEEPGCVSQQGARCGWTGSKGDWRSVHLPEVLDAHYADRVRAAQEKALEPVRELLHLWESWTGERPHPGVSSPRQREQLRTALDRRTDKEADRG